jgi:hypothetical protein
MACFVVPMSIAICIGAIRKKISVNLHINWLIMLLVGGTTMLIIDHIANQEIILYPPFLTAMSSPTATAVMLKEMVTLGSAMTIVCIGIWIAMVVYTSKMEQIKSKLLHQ